MIVRRLARLDEAIARRLPAVASRRSLALAVLLLLTLGCYLPGAIVLPPVDRSEIFFAENAQEMLERGEPINPHFIGEEQAFRPIGTFWLQVVSAFMAGDSAHYDITAYRLPSLGGATVAVLLIYVLLAPVIGAAPAFVSAALFAVTPIVAVESTLAIADGAALGPAVLAQLALLRIYVAPEGTPTRALALVFWGALGFSMLLNALAVPILSLVTVLALFAFDRRLDWLKRLHALVGIPLMLLLGAPWLIVRAVLDGGVPFNGMAFGEILAALGGSQHMQWKAAPLSFVLALSIGFLPGAVLWIPAVKGLWERRAEMLPRFLLCWLGGYLFYLELISSKPALYSVPVLFPAAAIAVVLAIARDGTWRWPRPALLVPTIVVVPGIPALYATMLWLTGQEAGMTVVVGVAVVTLLLALATLAGWARLVFAWTVLSVVAFAAFLSFTLGVFLPSLRPAWPAERIAEATQPLAACAPGPIGIIGFREPSTIFVLGDDTRLTTVDEVAGWAARGEPRIAVVEDRWQPDLAEALEVRSAALPARAGCITALNVMRGCRLSFSIYLTGAQKGTGCTVPADFACQGPPQTEAKPSMRCR